MPPAPSVRCLAPSNLLELNDFLAATGYVVKDTLTAMIAKSFPRERRIYPTVAEAATACFALAAACAASARACGSRTVIRTVSVITKPFGKGLVGIARRLF